MFCFFFLSSTCLCLLVFDQIVRIFEKSGWKSLRGYTYRNSQRLFVYFPVFGNLVLITTLYENTKTVQNLDYSSWMYNLFTGYTRWPLIIIKSINRVFKYKVYNYIMRKLPAWCVRWINGDRPSSGFLIVEKLKCIKRLKYSADGVILLYRH